MSAAEIIPMPAPVTPMTLIERAASDPNFPIEKLMQLFELKLRVEADEARKAFNEAMAKFKAGVPTITKNVRKKAGVMDLYYASLDNCVGVIAPALAAVGIRHRWENDQSVSGEVAVTCTLSHEMGHSESTRLKANYDTSGGKNAIQAIASAVTYLQRYTLLGATGLAATGVDNDGVGANQQMPDEEYIQRRDAIEGAVNEAQLTQFYLAAVEAAKKLGDKVSEDDFGKAKNKRLKELRGGAR